MRVCVFVCMYVFICLCVRVCLYACMYVWVRACVCVYVRMYVFNNMSQQLLWQLPNNLPGEKWNHFMKNKFLLKRMFARR